VKLLVDEEAGKLVNEDEIRNPGITNAASRMASSSSTRSTRSTSAAKRSQRPPRCRARACSATCWPLVEGTSVSTKVRPDPHRPHPVHRQRRLHLSKPSDLIPELQGRFPIRVETAVAVGAGLRGHS